MPHCAPYGHTERFRRTEYEGMWSDLAQLNIGEPAEGIGNTVLPACPQRHGQEVCNARDMSASARSSPELPESGDAPFMVRTV